MPTKPSLTIQANVHEESNKPLADHSNEQRQFKPAEPEEEQAETIVNYSIVQTYLHYLFTYPLCLYVL